MMRFDAARQIAIGRCRLVVCFSIIQSARTMDADSRHGRQAFKTEMQAAGKGIIGHE